MNQGVPHTRREAFLVFWTLADRYGWPIRADGYSLHVTYDVAKSYLQEAYNVLPDNPETYSYPGVGWFDTVPIVPVFISLNGILSLHVNEQKSWRIFEDDLAAAEIKKLSMVGDAKRADFKHTLHRSIASSVLTPQGRYERAMLRSRLPAAFRFQMAGL